MHVGELRRYWGYSDVMGVVGLSGVAYVLWKCFSEPYAEVDFKYIWLAGVVWREGGDPYGASYLAAAQEIFGRGATNVPQYWFYPPNWWPISTFLSEFDLSSADPGDVEQVIDEAGQML